MRDHFNNGLHRFYALDIMRGRKSFLCLIANTKPAAWLGPSPTNERFMTSSREDRARPWRGPCPFQINIKLGLWHRDEDPLLPGIAVVGVLIDVRAGRCHSAVDIDRIAAVDAGQLVFVAAQ